MPSLATGAQRCGKYRVHPASFGCDNRNRAVKPGIVGHVGIEYRAKRGVGARSRKPVIRMQRSAGLRRSAGEIGSKRVPLYNELDVYFYGPLADPDIVLPSRR